MRQVIRDLMPVIILIIFIGCFSYINNYQNKQKRQIYEENERYQEFFIKLDSSNKSLRDSLLNKQLIY